ncbi:alginate O-acetyltransferase [Bacteroidia bacterium]|nr:alginate O-acetyltransferase [Bacteroidia bacterium]
MDTIWRYSENDPLLFTKINFWIFFAVVLAIYALVFRKKQLRNAVLFGLSVYFYYKTGGYFFILLLFSTVTDFYFGLSIDRQTVPQRRKLFLLGSIAVNLAVLFYFKYAYFLTDVLNGLLGASIEPINYLALWSNWLTGSHLNTAQILLPVGISFYTFQTMSYTIDVYRRHVKPITSIIDFGFYVTFFPPLVAGPIVRASQFVPQLYRNYQVSSKDFSIAVFLILCGLIKKIAIADYISINFVDRVFDSPFLYSGFENLLAVYGYAIQIYCDFSGYTNIAIGVAMLLGFQLPQNFNSPYKATNISDFWRRWHISLSSWLKDYLYIPLGGNRHGWKRMYIALMLTMLIGGLWHGANNKFILWGGLHGLALCLHKAWRTLRPQPLQHPINLRYLSAFLTFHFVCFAWIFFRADSMDTAYTIIEQILHHFSWSSIFSVIYVNYIVLTMILLTLIIHVLPVHTKEWYQKLFVQTPFVLKFVLIIVLVLLFYQIQITDLQPFIYFQF